MIQTDRAPFHVILYEGAGSSPMDADHRFSIVSELLDRGYQLTSVSRTGTAPGFSAQADRMLVLGKFEGDAPAIEDANGVVDLEARNIDGLAVTDVLQMVEAFRDNQPMNQPPAAAVEHGAKSWKPWFPVIDYDRCTNCMQCLSFCLFDVYSVDVNNQIEVLNQDNCKTNCPACRARALTTIRPAGAAPMGGLKEAASATRRPPSTSGPSLEFRAPS